MILFIPLHTLKDTYFKMCLQCLVHKRLSAVCEFVYAAEYCGWFMASRQLFVKCT